MIKLVSVIFFVLISIFFGFIYTPTGYSRLNGPDGLGYSSTNHDVTKKYGTEYLNNKNIIVTGGYSGIGIDTIFSLAQGINTSIWLPARPESMSKCNKVAKETSTKTNNDNIFCEPMDLSSLKSIKDFCDNWKKKIFLYIF